MTYRAYISKPDLNEMHKLKVYKTHIEQFLHVLETCEDDRKCILDASCCKGMLKDINVIINHMINIDKEGGEKSGT